MFNSLLEKTKVPRVWLLSNIMATLKPGKTKTDVTGYRPIGLTCILSRVFEGRLGKAMDKHLEDNKLLDRSQHGFRKGRGCETNLLELMEYHACREEEGEETDGCYFDLKAFFDGIPHEKMLTSLHTHGIDQDGKVNRWIREWLGAGGQEGGRRGAGGSRGWC